MFKTDQTKNTTATSAGGALPRRALLAGAGVVAAALLLTACGSSSALKTAAGSSSTTAGSSSAATSAGSAASATPTPTVAATKAPILGNSSSSFCAEAKAQSAAEAQQLQAITGDTPADLQKLEEQAIAELATFEAEAPAQIKPAVTVIAQTEQNLFNQLKAVNFDYTKLGASFASSIDTPAFTQALQQLETYGEQVCGITPSAIAS